MNVFRIMLSGSRVVMKTEQGDEQCGFVKTEYVLAPTREEAVAKAKQKVQERLGKDPGILLPADSPLELAVDEVESGHPVWKLTSNESFIFFDLDADDESRS
jgi:hypothetical protein